MEQPEELPGECPRCARPTEWLEVDETRRGRICRGCGWVELPQTPVVRHTVASLIRRLLPHSPLVALIDYLQWRQARRK
ncbi:MAG TPA: hypothetical protein PLU39_04005 [Armatimonadota bacterium]|nr:hypothetical protein [Armatimonadota bacterium]HPT97011.1 hypothetical protein [Armatimonadota bacterium]